MDEETMRCRRFVRAIILQNIQDTVAPFGFQNNRKVCRGAFDFLFNSKTAAFGGFCHWCDLADFSVDYWRKAALMNLAYELSLKPWLRNRVACFLRGQQNLRLLKKFCGACHEMKYEDFAEALNHD